MHPIYTLDSLASMGVVERNLNVDEDTKVRYDFDLNDETYFETNDLERIKELFKADRIGIVTYYGSDQEKHTAIQIIYKEDIMGICE